jgi:serine/threonine protein kinase
LHLIGQKFEKERNYEILFLLGIGGFSKVYLARDYCGNLFAMKMIEKDFIIKNDKFKIVLQEKNILSMIDHPFINKLYETY